MKANEPVPFWKQPHIYVTAMFMVPIWFVVYKVVGDTNSQFSDTVKVMVITAIISTSVGAILGYWLGSSQSSAKKDDTNAALATQLAAAPVAPIDPGAPTGTPADPVNVKVTQAQPSKGPSVTRVTPVFPTTPKASP